MESGIVLARADGRSLKEAVTQFRVPYRKSEANNTNVIDGLRDLPTNKICCRRNDIQGRLVSR